MWERPFLCAKSAEGMVFRSIGLFALYVIVKQFFELGNRKGWINSMYHRMAVWANWDQILRRIDLILLTDRSDWNNMVHMNEAFSNHSINLPKIKATRRTEGAMKLFACFLCCCASFKRIDRDRNLCTLCIFVWQRNLFSQGVRIWIVRSILRITDLLEESLRQDRGKSFNLGGTRSIFRFASV